MRIAFVSTLLNPWGGSEELWSKTAELALSNGHQVLTIGFSQTFIPKHFEAIEARGGRIVWRANEILLKESSVFKKIIFRFKRFFKSGAFEDVLNKFSPDIILINQGGSYNAITDADLSDYLLKTSIPFILTARLTLDRGIPDHRILDKARRIYHKAVKVIFASKSSIASAELQLLQQLPQAIGLNSPLKLNNLELIPMSESTDMASFACVARLDINVKGQDIILRCLASEKWLSRKWRLNLYGKGDHLDYLKELSLYLNIADRVTFHGHVDSIEEIWKINHLLLLPSVAEGLPIALQEAMICGRPAIVTDVAGNRELIEDQLTGFIVKAPTVHLLDEALERAWTCKNEWTTIGKAARDKVLNTINLNPEKALLKLLTCDYR